MAIQYNFLAPIDQKVRDRGYDFVSQNKYLQDDFKSTDGISYEGDGSPVSYANSMGGIMSQAPIIYPPINQGGGGGGGKPPGPAVDNSQFDYETEAYGIDPSQGLTEEEQEALDNQIAGPKLGKLGTLATIAGMFTAPFSTIGFHHRRNKKKQKELEEKTQQAGIQADFDRAMAQGRDFYDTLNDGRGASVSDKSREEAGSGFNDVSESGPFAKGGRVGYFFGGRVNYKTGGRTDAESQYGADSVGSYDSSANQSDRGQSYGSNNKPPVSNDNRVVTTDFITENPSLTVNYTDPRNYASVYGKIGFDNILDNDDLTAAGNVTGEFGPIGYNTNFTDKGITGTNLTAGNFNANISPDMQVQNIGYSKGPFSISSDGQNTRAGLTFSYKNGGLAGLL